MSTFSEHGSLRMTSGAILIFGVWRFFFRSILINDMGKWNFCQKFLVRQLNLPRNCASKAHFGALLVPLATRAEIADLHYFIHSDQNAATKIISVNSSHRQDAIVLESSLSSTHLGLFKSRWIILCECRYCMPSAICFAHETIRTGCTTFSSFRIFCSGPNGQNSIIIQNTGDWVQTPL